MRPTPAFRFGLLTLFLVGLPLGIFAWPTDGRPLLSIRVYKESTRKKLDVDVYYAVPRDGEIHYISGGELPTTATENGLKFGTWISGRLHEDGKQLALRVEFSSPVATDDSPPQLVHGEFIDLHTTLKPGVLTRLKCTGDRWCEILLKQSSRE